MMNIEDDEKNVPEWAKTIEDGDISIDYPAWYRYRASLAIRSELMKLMEREMNKYAISPGDMALVVLNAIGTMRFHLIDGETVACTPCHGCPPMKDPDHDKFLSTDEIYCVKCKNQNGIMISFEHECRYNQKAEPWIKE